MKADRSISGVIAVDKPCGMTSHDVVNRMRRLFGTRKVGHTGTLDPMASGVLVILIGRAAKAAEYIQAKEKEYRATLQLGYQTASGDITGEVIARCECLPDAEAVERACASFRGDSMQVPPMVSALKVNGKKLLDLARQGIEVERQARPIHISRLVCTPLDSKAGQYAIEVACSKGTYIRTLCEDIGETLGCYGTMAALRRVRNGTFTLPQCHTLQALEEMSCEQRDACLAPVESVFADLARVTLPSFFARLAHAGCEIYQKKIGTELPLDATVSLYDADGFFALGQVRSYPDGSAIAPIKQFRLERGD